MSSSLKTTPYNTKRSFSKIHFTQTDQNNWAITTDGTTYSWSNKLERVALIRKGLPYSTIEVIAKSINTPIKTILELLNIPQTTYNKKKAVHALLDNHTTELLLSIFELLNFGKQVFNDETEKFQHWLNYKNLALGNETPLNFLDTITGINEVKNCLLRIEYGNFA